METLTLYLDTRNKPKSGNYNVKIRITLDRKSVYVGTDVHVKEEFWNAATKSVQGIREATRYNAYLDNLMTSIQEYFAKLTVMGEMRGKTLAELKNIAESIRDSGDGNSARRRKGEFLAAYHDMIDTRKTDGTRHIYSTALNNLIKYDPLLSERTFADIDKAYVEEYIKHRFDLGRKNNSVLNDLKGIQLVFNRAIEQGKALSNPAVGIKIKRGITIHRNLSAEFLRAVFNYRYDSIDQPYFDLFKLIFLLRGINVADLCSITPDMIVNGRLEYDRMKTGTHYSIKIEPEAYEIMEKYPSKTRLMSFLEGKDRKSMGVCLCKRLREAYDITPYSARHSVASIGAELDIPIDTISQLLGHKSFGRAITMVYVNYKCDNADVAMRRIIDYVLYGKK